MSSKIQFNNTQYIPILNATSWTRKNATVDSNYYLIIEKGGYAKVELTGLKDISFSYFKLFVKAYCESFKESSSVNSDALIKLDFQYESTDGDLEQCESYGLNIATVNKEANNLYIDTKILPSRNKRVYKCELTIYNLNLDEDLAIREIKLYTSADYSTSQITEILNTERLQRKLYRVTVGTNSDETLLAYLKAWKNSGGYTKFKPYYTGNKVSTILIDYLDGSPDSIIFDYEIDEDGVVNEG